ncbi:hypothetical protein ACRB68_17990 [Actinomadura sp. RB68]|uniref:Uncharacterized protein n=1 Tax=Actinomadura macrotermitis TaxID=2585200 RepID=A0A7K0BSV0_9ACTN|nr:hypothetical protein [Actinomadura macrotermitis]
MCGGCRKGCCCTRFLGKVNGCGWCRCRRCRLRPAPTLSNSIQSGDLSGTTPTSTAACASAASVAPTTDTKEASRRRGVAAGSGIGRRGDGHRQCGGGREKGRAVCRPAAWAGEPGRGGRRRHGGRDGHEVSFPAYRRGAGRRSRGALSEVNRSTRDARNRMGRSSGQLSGGRLSGRGARGGVGQSRRGMLGEMAWSGRGGKGVRGGAPTGTGQSGRGALTGVSRSSGVLSGVSRRGYVFGEMNRSSGTHGEASQSNSVLSGMTRSGGMLGRVSQSSGLLAGGARSISTLGKASQSRRVLGPRGQPGGGAHVPCIGAARQPEVTRTKPEARAKPGPEPRAGLGPRPRPRPGAQHFLSLTASETFQAPASYLTATR